MSPATCGTVSALTLGLPDAVAVPAARGALPKAAFVGRAPISAGLRSKLTNDVAAISLLGLMRPANAGVADGARIHEVLVLGLRLAKADAPVPTDVIDHIAAQRAGGVLFVCVREVTEGAGDGDGSGTAGAVEQCALAVRRRIPGRAGHVAQYAVHAGAWTDPRDVLLEVTGATMDELWESLCSQAILGTTDHADLDARIARRDRIAALEAEEARLVRDHTRAKTADQRNAAFAKLHKVRAELTRLRG
ncbi:hypothetical protein G1C96_0739 [Bifidobacterium sp. DSM 109958]|uniref:Tmp1 n=1 Tax=Bifidobacterium moraviense TaxID=2675323 RepID=A0A7Y0F188_9BIFI|nr:DUF4391 domain-containing protein [Bifidobacterium sp. DSM 109958]NMN00162.1 hypothetical protein [Bifidobacterium sp. DSM 109958]